MLNVKFYFVDVVRSFKGDLIIRGPVGQHYDSGLSEAPGFWEAEGGPGLTTKEEVVRTKSRLEASL